MDPKSPHRVPPNWVTDIIALLDFQSRIGGGRDAGEALSGATGSQSSPHTATIHHAPKFVLARPTSRVALAPRLLQQRLQPRPLSLTQITQVHPPILSAAYPLAYHFQGASLSFWTVS